MTLEHHEQLVKERYNTALKFSAPLLILLGVTAAEILLDADFLNATLVFWGVVAGLLIAAVPVTRHHKAKQVLEREKKLARLAELAAAMEEKP